MTKKLFVYLFSYIYFIIFNLGGPRQLKMSLLCYLGRRTLTMFRFDGKESACNAGDPSSIPGLGRSPWRREEQPSPVFWPGEFHEQMSLVAMVHRVPKSQT